MFQRPKQDESLGVSVVMIGRVKKITSLLDFVFLGEGVVLESRCIEVV